jgi:5-methylcytosine-specific restriction endonuclease McrA
LEHTATAAAAAAKYEAENKARAAARKKADREANPEKYRRRLAEYNATEAGKLNRHLRKLRRRAREFHADMRELTPTDWRRLVDRYRGCCAYCGASDKPLTREHIIPLARGGRHSIGNILPVCGSCNYSKADRLLIEWRAWKQSIAAA